MLLGPAFLLFFPNDLSLFLLYMVSDLGTGIQGVHVVHVSVK